MYYDPVNPVLVTQNFLFQIFLFLLGCFVGAAVQFAFSTIWRHVSAENKRMDELLTKANRVCKGSVNEPPIGQHPLDTTDKLLAACQLQLEAKKLEDESQRLAAEADAELRSRGKLPPTWSKSTQEHIDETWRMGEEMVKKLPPKPFPPPPPRQFTTGGDVPKPIPPPPRMIRESEDKPE